MRTATRLRDLAQYLHRQADTMIDVPGLTPWVDLLRDMSKLADKSAMYHRRAAVPLPSIESLAAILGDEQLSDPQAAHAATGSVRMAQWPAGDPEDAQGMDDALMDRFRDVAAVPGDEMHRPEDAAAEWKRMYEGRQWQIERLQSELAGANAAGQAVVNELMRAEADNARLQALVEAQAAVVQAARKVTESTRPRMTARILALMSVLDAFDQATTPKPTESAPTAPSANDSAEPVSEDVENQRPSAGPQEAIP